MASNSFGTVFKVMTWGESHGKAIGCVIDGCPAGIEIDEAYINQRLKRRSPGSSPFVSSRKEPDVVEILSGTFEGKTTGAPISLLIRNLDARERDYIDQKIQLRPGHANFTYLEKYAVFDWRGGGRASGRETACRVAAAAIAEKILHHIGITVTCYIKSIGSISADTTSISQEVIDLSPLFCPDPLAEKQMIEELQRMQIKGDSLGGVVEGIIIGAPSGLGDPIYEKLEAKLAASMMSIPASKAFEIGDGIAISCKSGAKSNDRYSKIDGMITTSTNHTGGILGGISTGAPILFRVHFKPTSSIRIEQETVDIYGNETIIKQKENSRHDPCLAIRAAAVCKAMAELTVVDALMMRLTNKMVDLISFYEEKRGIVHTRDYL